jgi:hypothetical protein
MHYSSAWFSRKRPNLSLVLPFDSHVKSSTNSTSAAQDYGRSEFPAEFRLALACARWPLKERDRLEIRQLAGGPFDWEWFKRIAERNQISPLVFNNLRDALPKARYSEILQSLRAVALGQTRHSMSQAAELVRVTESISSAGFQSVALKGVSLSAFAYGNLAMRSCGDIDLLVPPTQVLEVERILLGLGYERFEPRAELTPRRMTHYLRYYKHFTYISADRSTPLELHWRLFHNNPLLTDGNATFTSTMPVAVGPGVVTTLSRNELFLYLSVHGAIHGWPILKWLADIGALLGVMTAEDLACIVTLARERGLTAELRSALILVDSLLGVERPAIDLPDESSPILDRILTMARRLLSANDYCLEIHHLPRFGMFMYDLRLRSSWKYRSEDIRRSLFFPDDWNLIDLPDSLFPLYAAVRPVSWVLRHFPRLPRRQSATDPS